MNKYQSHKIVDAARITRFDASKDAEGETCYDLDLEGDDEVFVIHSAIGNRILQMAADADTNPVGGHLMVYPDGYISWSPHPQFDDGYDLLQPSSGQSKIAGYRQLTETEIELMNDVKALGLDCGLRVDNLRNQGTMLLDQRWISLGATHLQQGLMCLTRAIAKPDFF